MSALALASAALWRRRASATSLCTTLMFSELKISPRSVSSLLHAFRMMIASGSSSSSAAWMAGMVRPTSNLSVPCLLSSVSWLASRVTACVATGGSTRVGVVLALNSWSCVSRLMARRPADESRSLRIAIWSFSGLEKKRLAAVLIRLSESPTLTMALASTRTLIGRGTPVSSMSAVWSVMSRSTLMALLDSVVPVVSSGTSSDLPGPR